MTKPVLITFVKNPELGKVKTRLAKTVGDEQALRIYRALLTHTRRIVEAVDAQRLLFYSEEIMMADEWSVDHFQKFLQHPGDLGERMTAAFEQAFQIGRPVVIIGSDCAQLDVQIVEQAIAALQNHDFVIGPAEDGGYYLLGMRDYQPAIFKGIAWSTETVFTQSKAIIERLDATLSLLPTLSDIDYEEDWEKHGWPLD